MKKKVLLLITALAISSVANQLQFEGILPAGVDKTSMTAEYFRIYRAVAPQQRPDPRPLRIVYYSKKSDENFDNVLPEWGGGGAIGGNLIVVPTAFKPFLEQSFSQVTRHELVHAVLARAYPDLSLPRWFHEGVAMILSGELGFQENLVVSKAIFTGSLMPLSSIDSVNGFGRNRADLAYCQGRLAVLFLIDHYGMDVIPELLTAAKKRGSFYGGLFDILSISPEEFEALTRKDLTSRFSMMFMFADTYAFWAGIALLFLVAGGVSIVRKRKKLAHMEAEENESGEVTPVGPLQETAGPIASPPFTEESSPQADEQTAMIGKECPDKDDDDDYVLSDEIELEDNDAEEFEEDEGYADEEQKK
jgi:hypothetical protein